MVSTTGDPGPTRGLKLRGSNRCRGATVGRTGHWTRALRRLIVSDTYMNADSRPNLSTLAGRPVGLAIQPFESQPQGFTIPGMLGHGCGRSFAEKNRNGSVTRIDPRRRRIVRWASDDLASCLRRRDLALSRGVSDPLVTGAGSEIARGRGVAHAPAAVAPAADCDARRRKPPPATRSNTAPHC